jgi:hypothetical protein
LFTHSGSNTVDPKEIFPPNLRLRQALEEAINEDDEELDELDEAGPRKREVEVNEDKLEEWEEDEGQEACGTGDSGDEGSGVKDNERQNEEPEEEPALGELGVESETLNKSVKRMEKKREKKREEKREKKRESGRSSLTNLGNVEALIHDPKLTDLGNEQVPVHDPNLTNLGNVQVPVYNPKLTDDENIEVIAEHLSTVVKMFCVDMKIKPQGVYSRIFMSGLDGGKVGNLWNVYQNMLKTDEDEANRLGEAEIYEDEYEYEKYVKAGYGNFQKTFPDDWKERLQAWHAENSLILQVDGQDCKKKFAKFETSIYNFVRSYSILCILR